MVRLVDEPVQHISGIVTTTKATVTNTGTVQQDSPPPRTNAVGMRDFVEKVLEQTELTADACDAIMGA